ncbi:hypothetical protein PFISCL1PPCAC_21582, partial [Pristionchus fissidentatus]
YADNWSSADRSKDRYSFVKSECTKYVIIEPSVDHFVYEIMYSDVKESDALTLRYKTHPGGSEKASEKSRNVKMFFKCQKHKTTTGQHEE